MADAQFALAASPSLRVRRLRSRRFLVQKQHVRDSANTDAVPPKFPTRMALQVRFLVGWQGRSAPTVRESRRFPLEHQTLTQHQPRNSIAQPPVHVCSFRQTFRVQRFVSLGSNVQLTGICVRGMALAQPGSAPHTNVRVQRNVRRHLWRPSLAIHERYQTLRWLHFQTEVPLRSRPRLTKKYRPL